MVTESVLIVIELRINNRPSGKLSVEVQDGDHITIDHSNIEGNPRGRLTVSKVEKSTVDKG